MPEPETPVVETPQAPETPTPPAAPSSVSEAITLTRTELDRQIAAARRQAETDVKSSQEVRDLRARAKRADELEEAGKTEAEKLVSRAEKAEQAAAENGTRYRDALIRSEFAMTAPAKGIPTARIKAAMRLLNLSAVTVTDEGEVKGLDKALDDLIKENDFLVQVEARVNGVHVPASPRGANGEHTALAVADQAKREGRASARYRGLL